MSARDDFSRQLDAWLETQAPIREPEHLLGTVLARTARTRRRAAWRIPERWLPMTAITSRLVPSTRLPGRAIAVALIVLALLLATVAAFVGSQHRRAAPFGPAANGLVFYSDKGDVFTRDPGSGAVAKVVTGAGQDSDPVLSPDGSVFSFLRHVPAKPTQIWAANVDGSNVHRLAAPDTEPGWFEWSPQSDVAVVETDADHTAISIVPADGSAATRYDLGVKIESVSWRPSTGAQLVVLGTDSNGDRGIWLVKRDGTGLKRLDLDPGFKADADYTTNRDSYFWTMSWSPTGDRLLYTQLEDVPRSAASPGFRTHLAAIDAAGNVTSDRIVEFNPTADDELGATFFPSGNELFFQTLTGGRQTVATASVNGLSVGPAELQPLSSFEWIGVQVSPDGSKLLAVMPSTGGAAQEVDQLDLASGSVTPIQIAPDAAWQRSALP